MNEQSNLSEVDYLNFFLHPTQGDDFLKNYRKLADFFPALVYVYDTDNKKIGFFNKKFSEFLGYSNEDFASFSDTWSNIIFKDDVEKFNDELKKFYALKDDENYSFDSRFNRKQGDWRYFRTLGTVLKRKDDGQPAAFLFVAQDITDALNNSEELKKTKELFRETERLQRYGIYTYDIENDILTWSDGMYNLCEVEKKEENEKFNAAFSKSFINTEDLEQVTADYENAIQNGTDYDNEFSITTKKQNNRILLNRAKLIKNETGKAVKIIGSMRDITKEKLFERELQKTIKDLDRSNKELEEFAYIASHDLQEPLRKITTFSSRLRAKFENELGSEGKTYIERMHAATDNMRMLIESLLDISKATRNAQPFVPTDLNEILKTVKDDLELQIEEDEVTITSSELPVIDAIPSLMKQLFNNIISNAIKFHSPLRETSIQISSREIDKKDRELLLLPEIPFVEIAIKDNGIGFEQEHAEKVFQIFQRLHGKSEYPGSGIGLAICKKIVDKHNGIIWAKSDSGHGSSFFIILPQKQ